METVKEGLSRSNILNTRDFFRLDGRVALITGGAGMLGNEFAEALSDFGANIVLIDINEKECNQRAIKLSQEKSVECVSFGCDVVKKTSWEEMAEKVLSLFGRIDILVNAAAYTNVSASENYASPFEEFPLEDWNRIMEVNLTGILLGCQVIGKNMLARKKGTIINVASTYGVVSPHHRIYKDTAVNQPAAYSVSKAGVIALTRYLATLWAEKGVRVNSLTPGGVYDRHTNPFLERYCQLSPIGRMADRTEMRGALLYLASDASMYCTGHNLIVDGGWTAW